MYGSKLEQRREDRRSPVPGKSRASADKECAVVAGVQCAPKCAEGRCAGEGGEEEV